MSNLLITKSEFLKRVTRAVQEYKDQDHLTNNLSERLQLAAAVAKEYKLPAVPSEDDPITAAIAELGAPRPSGNYGNPLIVMIHIEAAWEHLLNNEEAYQAFKELNP